MNVDGTLAAGWPAADPPDVPTPGSVVGNGGPNDGPRLVADGAGGVVIAWIQYPEYYAMRFTSAGQLAGVPPGGVVALGLRAHFDRGAGVRVWFSAGGSAAAKLELFDVAGRLVASTSLSGASGDVTLPGTRRLAGGVYLARLATDSRVAFTKLVALP